MAPDADPPFTHPVRVVAIRQRGTDLVLRPDEAERAALAEALGLEALDGLVATYSLSRSGDKVKLSGEIEAELRQVCVVTLEPFSVSLKVPVKLDFAPELEEILPRKIADREIDLEVRLNEEDPPEPIVDGTIDLGAVTQEFLALSLDPYPRKPGVSFDAAEAGMVPESPFAALAKLKREQ